MSMRLSPSTEKLSGHIDPWHPGSQQSSGTYSPISVMTEPSGRVTSQCLPRWGLGFYQPYIWQRCINLPPSKGYRRPYPLPWGKQSHGCRWQLPRQRRSCPCQVWSAGEGPCRATLDPQKHGHVDIHIKRATDAYTCKLWVTRKRIKKQDMRALSWVYSWVPKRRELGADQ